MGPSERSSKRTTGTGGSVRPPVPGWDRVLFVVHVLIKYGRLLIIVSDVIVVCECLNLGVLPIEYCVREYLSLRGEEARWRVSPGLLSQSLLEV